MRLLKRKCTGVVRIKKVMKTIIRWLSNISGVTREIIEEERKYIGGRLIQYSYWFNGGLMYSTPLTSVANFAMLFGEALKEDNCTPDISTLRDNLYKMEAQELNVFDHREVYGYWSDKQPHFIGLEEYSGKKGYRPLLRIKFK